MISNRRGRNATPVETINEFAVNTIKGIDVTRAPIDLSTVSYAKNLINNPDGSLSLRKPLKLCSNGNLDHGAYFKIFNGEYIQWDAEKKILYLPDTAVTRYYNYKGELVSTDEGADCRIVYLFGNPTVVNLNTATIIGNMCVYTSLS